MTEFGQMLVRNIDGVLGVVDDGERTRFLNEQTAVVLQSLRTAGISVDSLEHLVVGYHSAQPFKGYSDDRNLRRIQEVAMNHFGEEVLARLDFGFSDEKLRNFIA